MKSIHKILLLVIVLFMGFFIYLKNKSNRRIVAEAKVVQIDKERLRKHIDLLKSFIAKNTQYNQRIIFLIDMKIRSGKNRFFIYDVNQNKLLEQGLVAHGSGSEIGNSDKLSFNNIVNSNATSLGKYSIGNSYIGKFGKAYKLNGLDKTNSNAFDRTIVLHAYQYVPFEEQDKPICNSLGCPMVNEKFFKVLEKYIDQSNKNIVLEIFY